MWELDHKQGAASKNLCFWTMVLEKILESPLDCMEIKPVHPKGNQFWIFTGRTDVEPETPILWPPEVKSQLTGKDPDAGKDWGQEEKGPREDEMVGWHPWLDAHELENSGRHWKAGKPGVLRSRGSKRAGHNWATEKQLLLMGIFSNYIFWSTNGHVIRSLILHFHQ